MRQPCLQVELPDELLKTFFNESGYANTTIAEKRSRARLRVRKEVEVSLLDVLTNEGTRRTGNDLAIVKDLSKTGIAILYHQQLFPEDTFQVRLCDRLITAVAVRCRRLGDKCYEIGAQISEMQPSISHWDS